MFGEKSLQWIRVHNRGSREKLSDNPVKHFTTKGPLPPPPHSLPPTANYIVPKRPQPGKVPRHSLIVEVAPHYGTPPFPGVPDRLVHSSTQLCLDGFQLCCHTFADCLPQHRELSRLAYASANVRETQKIEGFRLPFPIPPSTFDGKSPQPGSPLVSGAGASFPDAVPARTLAAVPVIAPGIALLLSGARTR